MVRVERCPAFQWYPRDFAAKMRLLQVDDLTELAYRRALDASWDSGACGVGSLEDWFRWAGLPEGSPVRVTFEALLRCETQQVSNACLVQFRMVTHRNEQLSSARKRARAGSKGGRKSQRSKRLKQHSSTALALLPTATASAVASAVEEKKKTPTPADAGFLLWWGRWQGNGIRKLALEAWKRLSPEDRDLCVPALEAQIAWRASAPPGAFVPHWQDAQRWLKNRRWEDRLTPWPVAASTPRMSDTEYLLAEARSREVAR